MMHKMHKDLAKAIGVNPVEEEYWGWLIQLRMNPAKWSRKCEGEYTLYYSNGETSKADQYFDRLEVNEKYGPRENISPVSESIYKSMIFGRMVQCLGFSTVFRGDVPPRIPEMPTGKMQPFTGASLDGYAMAWQWADIP